MEEVDDFRSVIDDFCQHIAAQGTQLRAVVVYIACHGMQIDGEVYLVPADANLKRVDSVSGKCLALSELVKKISTFSENEWTEPR